jgi:hypothetical protein
LNALNSAATALFDALLWPLERVGPEFALVVLSGLFGALALIVFKYISWQRGIKAAKEKIKGHMIAIRIYQDDLAIVGGAVVKVLLRNAQYFALNFAPIVPLAAPFTLAAAQLVTRYGFAPLEVEAGAASRLAGTYATLEVEMRRDARAAVLGLEVRLPDGLEARSPLVRNAESGRAWIEFRALRPGAYDVELACAGVATAKRIVAGGPGDAERHMQPERVGSFWDAWLWPAEDTLAGSAFQRVAFEYPERELAWLPDGPGGVLLTFVVASILFGIAIIKPLGIQI